MGVKVSKPVNRRLASAEDLAADFKAQGYSRHYAWDKFIIERGLRPEMDAKKFYAIFDSVAPARLIGETTEIDFRPTHMDIMWKKSVQITAQLDGVYLLLWDDGSTGSNPPCLPPDPERYILLKDQEPDVN